VSRSKELDRDIHDTGGEAGRSRRVPYAPASTGRMRLSQVVRRGAYRLWRRRLRGTADLSTTAAVAILDIGCGPGYFLREARRWFPKSSITGLDSEFALFDWVGIADATLVQGTAERLPFAEQTFDIVACLQVLEHVGNPDAALAEMHRVLKPGGFACVATPNTASWSARVAGRRWHGYRDDHISLRSAGEWRKALNAAGFDIVDDGTTLFSGMPIMRWPPLILVSWIPLYLFGSFHWNGGESYVAFCRKRSHS
jgi:2-polyprenyl-3-methyl-5-hydroxy-6-metoxy-1,4-benzoquinol methylase